MVQALNASDGDEECEIAAVCIFTILSNFVSSVNLLVVTIIIRLPASIKRVIRPTSFELQPFSVDARLADVCTLFQVLAGIAKMRMKDEAKAVKDGGGILRDSVDKAKSLGMTWSSEYIGKRCRRTCPILVSGGFQWYGGTHGKIFQLRCNRTGEGINISGNFSTGESHTPTCTSL